MNILLAVSGGCDSMYLANRASEIFPGASFAVAHCNFLLRADESDGDESFVRDWCASHGIRCFVQRFDTEAYAAEKGISIEMAARELRYGWFARLCSDKGFDAVAVAHNANDNAETLILNLLRGTGSRGLRGMAEDSVQGTLRILRPMLGISREDIKAWMTDNACNWREDSSNALCEYKRNRIRNSVFPLFREINPSFVQTLSEDMKHFAQADDITEDYLAQAREKVMDGEAVSVHRLLELKHWKFVLWRLLEPAKLSRPTFAKMLELLGRYASEPRGTVTLGGKTFESPEYDVVIKDKRIWLVKKQ